MTSEAEGDATNAVLDDIMAERMRQRDQKHYDDEHDDLHVGRQLVFAACAYALSPVGERIAAELMWPWSDVPLKQKPDRMMLVRAAALLVAEIERLDRQKARGDATHGAEETP